MQATYGLSRLYLCVWEHTHTYSYIHIDTRTYTQMCVCNQLKKPGDMHLKEDMVEGYMRELEEGKG